MGTIEHVVTVEELRSRLRRPLERELRNGCQDSVVVGGLEKLVATVGAPFADVRSVMNGYGSLTPEERSERLEQALGMLEVGAQPQQQSPTPDPYPPPLKEVGRGSSDSLSSDDLDKDIADKTHRLRRTSAQKARPCRLKKPTATSCITILNATKTAASCRPSPPCKTTNPLPSRASSPDAKRRRANAG